MIVIVLGVGRCGSSALAEVLHKSGIHMGDNLMACKGPENPHGYYEDMDFKKLNEKILNGYCYKQFALKPATIDIDYDVDLSLVDQREKTHKAWGFKDPRTIFTLPAYIKKLQNHDVRYVIIKRELKANCASLIKQQNSIHDVAHARAVYRSYNDHIQRYNLENSCLIEYEQLLEKDVKGLESFLGLKLNTVSIDKKLNRMGK
jgi:hypothetical protein